MALPLVPAIMGALRANSLRAAIRRLQRQFRTRNGISVEADVDDDQVRLLARKLSGIAPALEQRMPEITRKVLPEFRRRVASHLDRPRPSTLKAINSVTVSRGHTRIGVDRELAGVFGRLVYGGTERGGPFLVPVSLLTDTYGNLPRGALNRLRSDSTVFEVPFGSADSRSAHLVPGFWRRQGGGLELLAVWVDERTYDPQIPWLAEMCTSFEIVIKDEADALLGEALR